MNEIWRILSRVRDVRTRLALNEVRRERQVQARARAQLEQARSRKAQLEEQAARASRLVAAIVEEAGTPVFNAAQAQQILDYVAGARLQARQATAPIRRAQLQCDRAQEAVNEANAKYRREASGKETVNSEWQKALQAAERLRFEREDTNCAEDRAGIATARRARGPADPAGGDYRDGCADAEE